MERQCWERLWMMSDRRTGPRHPLVYKHPDTGRPTLCFHLGMTAGFLLDGEPEQQLGGMETAAALQYRHEYRQGDLVITDNLAVGHEASPDTQLAPEEIGLRVMHRVTLAGKTRPSK